MKYIHGTHEEEQERLFTLNRLLNNRCLEKIILNGSESALDIGCGLGVFTRMLTRQLGKGKVVGIERSTEQLEKAAQLADRDNEYSLIDFREGSAYDLPLQDNEWANFDLVFIRFLLEHLSSPLEALAQAKKAVKSGGKIVLIADDHANLRITLHTEAFEILWKLYCKVYESLGTDPFIGRNLVTLLHQSGFQSFKIDFVLFGAASSEPDFKHYANNLLGILVGAKKEIMNIGKLNSNDFDRYIEEIVQWSDLEDATLWYAANWAEAIS
ncbi:MAG: class I SAM-dependent methyltransferase [Saprospiraceae bacterium]|nr:class I SAM-dependent methyltransferase [Saprospiraceae bacterium]